MQLPSIFFLCNRFYQKPHALSSTEHAYYKKSKDQYGQSVEKLTARHHRISTFRLTIALLFLFAGYQLLNAPNLLWSVVCGVSFVLFFISIRKHQAIARERNLHRQLLRINDEELDFLHQRAVPFEDGDHFVETQHPYAFDLDFFGPRSLYHHLNRTSTYQGEQKLAGSLLTPLHAEDIPAQQEAVQELAEVIEWRQQFLAISRTQPDQQKIYDYLDKWSTQSNQLGKGVILLSYVLGAGLLGSLLALIFTGQSIYFNIASFWFIGNLALLASQFKRIQKELLSVDRVDRVIRQYGLLIQHIDQQTFKSDRLVALQNQLRIDGQSAAQHLINVSQILGQLDSIHNGMALLFLDGPMAYHLHKLNALNKWKKTYGPAITTWLQTIGTFEMLASYGNLYYNNPDFTFPSINNAFEIGFKNLGHPLIPAKSRIGNDVTFDQEKFIILTGSNMSGKSTFLRSLGINLILASAGAPICASEGHLHPLPVFVSMRLSDSLADNESYFYAEVKRLHQIMTHLDQQRSFILLDEILRGTNSEDKRSGTLQVIEKMYQKGVIGAIATHDLEVCNITNTHPDYLINKCFEVEIIDDDLHFDYKLRDGICRNQSASFLMRKMGVI